MALGCAPSADPAATIEWYGMVTPGSPGAEKCPVTWEGIDKSCKRQVSSPMLPPLGTISIARFSEPRVSIDGLKCFTNVCVSQETGRFVFYYKDTDLERLVTVVSVGLIRRSQEKIGFVLLTHEGSLGTVYLQAQKSDDSAIDVLRAFPGGK
jgi:hypothetical protein